MPSFTKKEMKLEVPEGLSEEQLLAAHATYDFWANSARNSADWLNIVALFEPIYRTVETNEDYEVIEVTFNVQYMAPVNNE